MSPIKILSIDGGGIRGVIPALILSEIEKRTGKKITELFDLLAGTSTGGIIAVGLNVNDPETGAAYSAQKIAGLYELNGEKIFKKRSFFSSVGGLAEEAFQHEGLEEVLKSYFGDAELKDSHSALLVTSYDIEQRKPFYFLSREARMKPDTENFLMRDIARSTSAAPTYFEPHWMPWAENGHLTLVDGGVFANNPSVLAYTEAINLMRLREFEKSLGEPQPIEDPNPSESRSGVGSRDFSAGLPEYLAPDRAPDFFMVSLGTGQACRPYPYEKAKGWGMVQWVQPIIDILMQGVSESVHYQMQYLLPPTRDGRQHYYRINPAMPESCSEMSNVSEENMQALQGVAREVIEQESGTIDAICQVLLS